MDKELEKLFEGSDFTQEFKDKVKEIFENALAAREAQITEEVEGKYEKLSEDYAEYVVTEMEDKTQQYLEEEVMPMVEKYLDYATGEFMKENKIAVESGTKVELAEQFLTGMVGIAESFNVKVPEGQDDYIKEMQDKVDAIQARFDTVLEEKNSLEDQIKQDKMDRIIEAKAKDLTESQKEKFEKVAQRVKFQDEEQFVSSIDELYESYFPAQSVKEEGLEELKEEQEQPEKPATKASWEEQLFNQI